MIDVMWRHGSRRPRSKSQQLLLVEDDADLLWVYTLVLSRYGYDVTTATGVDTARKCWEMGPFDFVVSDDRLGDGEGVDVIAIARCAIPCPVTVLMSIHSDVRTGAALPCGWSVSKGTPYR
jgi:DNA-binding NtrC family response regulator